MPAVRQSILLTLALLSPCLLAAACGGSSPPAPPPPAFATHTIEIDIDDHGLAGLWMANAPNLKGLIARGTLAFSRVVVPTHSNQNNMALVTGQYPDGDNVPSNAWLSRSANFSTPVNLPGVAAGDYILYDKNPLLTRGDSVYRAVQRAGGKTAYFGQLPPFEAGADDVHLTIVGASFGATTITPPIASGLLTGLLHYPKSVVDSYHIDGPAAPGETYLQFTMRDAAALIRATSAQNPMPAYMFIWDFIAIDDDPTAQFGADGDAIVKIDRGVRRRRSAMCWRRCRRSRCSTTPTSCSRSTTARSTPTTRWCWARAARASTPPARRWPPTASSARWSPPRARSLGITPADYAMLNEDGDALIYARVPGAGTDAGAARQTEVTHALLSLIQSGQITGIDVTRTMTADGALGTRTFHDFRGSSPNQADIVVFPIDDWTLNQVDATNTQPGPFIEHAQFPYGRHGGFSDDELYVPLILAGPAFKVGALVPHPIEHPDVAATAVATLGTPRLATAARGPIRAVLAGDASETWSQPADFTNARTTVLDAAGYGSPQALASAAAAAAVIIDVAGLYDGEIFDDPALATLTQPLRDLAAQGTRFSDAWCRSRDWPVTEYQLLAGGYPAALPFFAAAEDDPAQTVAPGAGLMQMPVAPGFIANQAAYAAWRQATPFAGQSLFDAAHALGMSTALIGQPDFHALHLGVGRHRRGDADRRRRGAGRARRPAGAAPSPAGPGGDRGGAHRRPPQRCRQGRAPGADRRRRRPGAGGERCAGRDHQPGRDGDRRSAGRQLRRRVLTSRAAGVAGPQRARRRRQRTAGDARRSAGNRAVRSRRAERQRPRHRDLGARHPGGRRPSTDAQRRHRGARAAARLHDDAGAVAANAGRLNAKTPGRHRPDS